MSTKNLFHAFQDYLSMRPGEPVDAFFKDADWNVTERSATANNVVEDAILLNAFEQCGSGERYLLKTLRECLGSIVWHTCVIGNVNVPFVEIIGPRGHFPSSDIAGGVLIVPPDTTISQYYTDAEALIIPLNNCAEFSADQADFGSKKSGDILFHDSNERRAIKTADIALAAIYVLRDGDLQQQPET